MICIILGKYDPKKNCLMLQGGSNAGKTYWSTALVPIRDVVGGTVNSTDFTFQKCLELIIIPELSLTKPEQMEELKQVMEGYPILANIKNKEPRILKRTPILLQCNQTPWSKVFEQERLAFQNRIHSYTNLKPSNILTKVNKKANPVFFQNILKRCLSLFKDKGQPIDKHTSMDRCNK